MPSPAVTEAVNRLASRAKLRTEADVQADIHLLLTSGQLDLDPDEVVKLEAQVGDGTRRRLDVEVGRCVIEVKKDLRISGVRLEAKKQLAGYVRTQSIRLGIRYVGILTDGTEWALFHLHDDELVEVASLVLPERDPDPDRLLVWLESVLSTQESVPPTPVEIEQRLGANSPAHRLDHATLADLYQPAADVPEVKLKRDLWAKLLRTAFGTAFADDENLFIDHTLLVLTAEIIAHAVVGYDVSPQGPLTPEAITRGTAFTESWINGVVEADFFDWVVEVPGGPEFVSELARRIARFDWSHVEHDVLKILYESVISSEARASLGEYYTPDWLADRVVADTVTDPLTSTVMDPSCGSGTFLFHAVRAYLAAAEGAGLSNGEAVQGLTRRVYGMDVHPVAVTLARVTYLLAIGRERLSAEDRGEIVIPVYLGDSLQWEQRKDLFGGIDTITIATAGSDLVEGGGGVLFGDDLVFPRSVLADAERFDRLVREMADKALDVSNTLSRNLIDPILRRFKIEGEDAKTLTSTFDTMRQLHRSGRNHIWGYYVRNLIRPLWLSEPDNRVDVLVGNPPWLRYSKMTSGMQDRYKKLARERQLLTGGLGASARDLSTLFVVRAIELYLREAGRFAFVMPHGTLTRKPHAGFRSGQWSSSTTGHLAAEFGRSWDLADVTTGFPMVSCVVRGTASTEPSPITSAVEKWQGWLPRPDMPWGSAQDRISVSEGIVGILGTDEIASTSPYRARFRQGAILVPRMLLFIEESTSSPLGAGAGRTRAASRRTTLEKSPWKEALSLSGVIERKFVRPVFLGESIVPFRSLDPLKAILPISDEGILNSSDIDLYPGLAQWWQQVEEIWAERRVRSETLPLLERFNHLSQLSAQLPTAAHRVVYTKSGNTLAAARVENAAAIIDHKLYWAAAHSVGEGQYLTAVLNSDTVLERVKPLQALGLFGGRDFDKNVFSIPIQTYDSSNDLHVQLAVLAAQAEEIAAGVQLDGQWTFQKSRKEIREALAKAGISEQIEKAVADLIPDTTAIV
ncbi:N-6 DNA methylase [Nocardia tengchongensis]|uniref:N-6 DNA methylase n=1 Tax=Nocardia tengchongensis TaxID=2055889 RepID=UPI003683A803